MALTFPKRGFAGAAVAGTIATPGLTSADGAGVTFTSSTTLTGWTDITGGTFSGDNLCITFGYGTANEEKILCTFNSATNTFTIVTRGYDGTSAHAWAIGQNFILTSTATEAAELNAATQSLKTILQNSGTTTTPQPISVGSGVGAVGTGTVPAAIDHDHKISVSTLNGWLTGSASGALPTNVTISLSQITNPPTVVDSVVSGNYSCTSTSTNVFVSNVSPTGNFKTFLWNIVCQQQANATGAAAMDVTATIRYRTVGSGTWINGTAITVGTALSTNSFTMMTGNGIITVGSANNYEFNIQLNTSNASYTAPLRNAHLTVQGIN